MMAKGDEKPPDWKWAVYVNLSSTGSAFIREGTTTTTTTKMFHPPWEVALHLGFVAVVCFLALGGNFLVLFSLTKKEQLLVPSNRLVFSLTSSNFVFALLVFPFIMVSIVLDDWIFGVFWCNFTAFVTVLVTTASVLTIGVIAIDRYYAIVRPLLYTLTITNSRSTWMLLAVWFLAFSCALPPLFGWSKFHYQKTEAACIVDWSADIGYTCFVLLTSFIAPLSAMLVCYYFIFQVVRTKCRKIHVGSVAADARNENGLATVSGNRDLPSIIVRQSSSLSWRFTLPVKPSWLVIPFTSPVKGLRTICVVLGVFLTTTTPYFVFAFVTAFLGYPAFPSWFHVCAVELWFSSSATHPIVYGLFNRSIRKEVKSCVFSRIKMKSKGLPRIPSRRPSTSISLLDFSPLKSYKKGTKNGRWSSRRSSTTSFDAFKLTNTRKGSEDSGAVMTESEYENEANQDFSSRRYERRSSAPSRLQFIHTVLPTINSHESISQRSTIQNFTSHAQSPTEVEVSCNSSSSITTEENIAANLQSKSILDVKTRDEHHQHHHHNHHHLHHHLHYHQPSSLKLDKTTTSCLESVVINFVQDNLSLPIGERAISQNKSSANSIDEGLGNER